MRCVAADEKDVFLVANLKAGGADSCANFGESGMIYIFNKYTYEYMCYLENV